MQHVMVVVPVDADINEIQDVTEEHRQHGQQVMEAVAMRRLHLQHHDRDDDCDHAVAECLQASGAHLPSPLVPWLGREAYERRTKLLAPTISRGRGRSPDGPAAVDAAAPPPDSQYRDRVNL